jgi:hypothetical protein
MGMNTSKKEKVARLLAIASVLTAFMFLTSCSSLWSTAGAGVGAGIGALVSPVGAAVGAVGGALGGSLVEEEDRSEAAEQLNREVVESLIAASSDEAKKHALDIVADSSASVLDEVKSFIASLAKWLAGLSVVYFVGKILLNRRQEEALVERVKNLVGNDDDKR